MQKAAPGQGPGPPLCLVLVMRCVPEWVWEGWSLAVLAVQWFSGLGIIVLEQHAAQLKVYTGALELTSVRYNYLIEKERDLYFLTGHHM